MQRAVKKAYKSLSRTTPSPPHSHHAYEASGAAALDTNLLQLVPPHLLQQLGMQSVVDEAAVMSEERVPAMMECVHDDFSCDKWQLQNVVQMAIVDGAGRRQVLRQWTIGEDEYRERHTPPSLVI